MINYWQTDYYCFDTVSLIENVSVANVSPALSSSENIKLFNQGPVVKRMTSYILVLRCNWHNQAWSTFNGPPGERRSIWGDTQASALLVTKPMSLPCCSVWLKVLAIVCFFFLCVIDVSAMLSYFPAQLECAAPPKKKAVLYLVSDTGNIDQKHVLLREDKHASLIPPCQFSLWQKALECNTTGLGWSEMIASQPAVINKSFLYDIYIYFFFVRCMNFDHLCSWKSLRALGWWWMEFHFQLCQ